MLRTQLESQSNTVPRFLPNFKKSFLRLHYEGTVQAMGREDFPT